MTWSVVINGQRFERFKSLRFSRDIEQNIGQFSFEASDASPKSSGVLTNDDIRIMYKDKVVMTGWVDKLDANAGLDGRTLEVSGRDQLCDLVDSSIPDAAKVSSGKPSLLSVSRSVMGALGLPFSVYDTTKDGVGSLQVINQKVADAGEMAMGFLAKLAARHQVWMIADENSNLRIMRAAEFDSDHAFIFISDGNGVNNIDKITYSIDMSQLYSRVRVVSQTPVAYETITKEIEGDEGDSVFEAPKAATSKTTQRRSTPVQVLGEATDTFARRTRYLEIRGTEAMNAAEAERRARDEINSRKARAFVYTCQTHVFESPSGQILRIGDTVQLLDEAQQLRGRFVLAGFSVQFSIDGGTKCDLRLAPRGAYQIVDPQPDKIQFAKTPKVRKPRTRRAKETKPRVVF